MPIPLGILAAAGFRPTAGGSYELIETITVGAGGADSVTFSNLNTYSTTYQHLQIRMVQQYSQSGGAEGLFLRFNGDSAGNYAHHRLLGNGSNVTSTGATSTTNIFIGYTTNQWVAGVVDILDAYEAKNKTTRSLIGGTGGAVNEIHLTSGHWRNTNGISSINIDSLNSFVQGSRFSIYGLKAS